MRSALVLILCMLFTSLILAYLIFPYRGCIECTDYYYSEYYLNIDEGDNLEVEWQYTELNHSIFNKLINETDGYVDMPEYTKGDTIVWNISIEGECSDYWEVLNDEYKMINDEDTYITSQRYRIYKSPEDYIDKMLAADNYYTNRLIPCDVYDFLDSMENHLQFSEATFANNSINYVIEGKSITKVFGNLPSFNETFTYNEDGILRYYGIYYENQFALELKLVDYEIHYNDDSPSNYMNYYLRQLLFFINIASIILVIVLIATDDSHKKKSACQQNFPLMKMNHQLIGKNQLKRQFNNSGKNSKSPNLQNQSCSNCNTLLDDKSKFFCINCGKKIEEETKFCQYCGKLSLANANYCYSCGHIF